MINNSNNIYFCGNRISMSFDSMKIIFDTPIEVFKKSKKEELRLRRHYKSVCSICHDGMYSHNSDRVGTCVKCLDFLKLRSVFVYIGIIHKEKIRKTVKLLLLKLVFKIHKNNIEEKIDYTNEWKGICHNFIISMPFEICKKMLEYL